MMKFRYSIVCFLLLCGVSYESAPAEDGLDYEAFGKVVVQHDGRLKPLDKFARTSLTMFHEKASFTIYDADGHRIKKKAIEWLVDTLLYPQQAFDAIRPVGANRRGFDAIRPHPERIRAHRRKRCRDTARVPVCLDELRVREGFEQRSDLLQVLG